MKSKQNLVIDLTCWLIDKKIVKYVTNDSHRRSSLFYNKSARHWRHECDTSYISDISDTSSKRVKILLLITTLIKAYFHVPILAIWQIKDHKERNNFSFEELLFRNVSFPCQNVFEKCTTKLNFAMAKSISISHTLDCNCKWTCALPNSNTVLFSVKIVLCETITTFF